MIVMNNLICIFFEHVDDKLLLKPGTELTIIVNDIEYANFRRCKRCRQIFIQNTTHEDGDTLS